MTVAEAVMSEVTLNINGVDHTVDVTPDMPLLWALRDILNLTGTSVEKNVLDQMDAQDPEVAEAVRNLMFVFDDIVTLDDRTIQGSEKAGQRLEEFTRGHIDAFKEDMACLGIQPADDYPLASEHVDDMVQLARKLVQKGFAYDKLRSLYFDISRLPAYGRLSGIDLEKIRLGHTVDLDEYEKDNPRDFTLLKRARLSELKRGLFTKTEWGNVRPSWHIQCVAMATKYLGETIDIHTGGRELVFPHHENEIAIAGALTGKTLAKYWIHCDRVLVDGKTRVNARAREEVAPDRGARALRRDEDDVDVIVLSSPVDGPADHLLGRMIAAINVMNALFMVVGAVAAATMLALSFTIPEIFFVSAIVTIFVPP